VRESFQILLVLFSVYMFTFSHPPPMLGNEYSCHYYNIYLFWNNYYSVLIATCDFDMSLSMPSLLHCFITVLLSCTEYLCSKACLFLLHCCTHLLNLATLLSCPLLELCNTSIQVKSFWKLLMVYQLTSAVCTGWAGYKESRCILGLWNWEVSKMRGMFISSLPKHWSCDSMFHSYCDLYLH
jgi:hypothetical protein